MPDRTLDSFPISCLHSPPDASRRTPIPRFFRRPASRIPPEILPPDFLTRHGLARRLYLEPLTGLTPAHPWAPLTDAEWEALAPHLAATGCGLRAAGRAGRPLADPRARLDAIFRAVTLKRSNCEGGGRAPWRALPEGFGKAGTVSRCHRRWAHAGLWGRLLQAVAAADCPAALAALTWRICCAFRRAVRVLGLAAIVLARRLRLHSALPAPSQYLPDPELAEITMPVCLRAARYMLAHPRWRPPRGLLRLLQDFHRFAGGLVRVPGALEPP